jgi:small subunit ribosomal protein S29
MKFDGHFLRNGFKLLATSHYRQFNHKFDPKMIKFPHGYTAKVDNLALNDFRNMIFYKNLTEWMPDFYKDWEIESYYMETQGNWNAFHDSYNGYQRVHHM